MPVKYKIQMRRHFIKDIVDDGDLNVDEDKHLFDGHSYCAIGPHGHIVVEIEPDRNLTRGEAIEEFRLYGLDVES